ncbi:hypothetical protein, partial [Heyndrickxia coagulans]|uniref:hypothetical protein n=1 Tax=Heyndrickxia coagulans TaxID=1398 RepID=UPI00214D1DD8
PSDILEELISVNFKRLDKLFIMIIHKILRIDLHPPSKVIFLMVLGCPFPLMVLRFNTLDSLK